MAKKKLAEASTSVPAFEECLCDLEAIVGELESGKLGLSDALARYEQGVRHLKSCHQVLESAERKIELLSGIDANGNPITQPFDEQEYASFEEKAAARGRRRTSEPSPVKQNGDAAGGEIDESGRLF